MISIRRQITISLLIGFSVLWGTVGISIYWMSRNSLTSEFDSLLRARATAIAALTVETPKHIFIDHAPKIGPASGNNVSEEFLQLSTLDGQIQIHSSNLGKNTFETNHGTLELPFYGDLTLPDQMVVRVIGFEFAPDIEEDETGKGVGDFTPKPLVMVFAKNRLELDNTLSRLRNVLILVTLTGLLGTLFLIRMSIFKILSPIADVSLQATRIDAESLQLRFSTENLPSELIPICRRFNDLLSRLGESFERERRFGASVAHELRTPIAELRSMAEVALKWPEEHQSSEILLDVVNISKQMERIVNSLLALARCESGKQSVAKEKIILSSLVQEIWNPLLSKVQEKKITHEFEIKENLQLETDRTLLGAILINLITNAVEYTPEGGKILVTSKTTLDQFEIYVENTVENITEQDLKHFSERFWRKDEARSSSEHAGLGLSVTKAFAQVLGISFHLRLLEKNILRISLSGKL
jgi:signal transduction histidine kinase